MNFQSKIRQFLDFRFTATLNPINFLEDLQVQNKWKKNAKLTVMTGFENCLRGIEGIDTTLSYLNDDIILFLGSDIPSKLEDNSLELSDSSKYKHLCTGYLASVSIISNRYKIINQLIRRMLSNRTKNMHSFHPERKSLQKQFQELKRDYIILAETELLLLEKLRPSIRNGAIRNLKSRLENIAA